MAASWRVGVFVSLLLVASVQSQSVKTINGSLILQIAGATMTLQSASPSTQASSVLEPVAYFQPQINNMYGLLNNTNVQVASVAAAAASQAAAEMNRASTAEASLGGALNNQVSSTLAQLALETSRATSVERSIAQSVANVQQTAATPVSAAVVAEASRATAAEMALATSLGQTQASVAQASAAAAALAAGIDGRFSTSVMALSAVLGGQLGANLAQAATQYSTAVGTMSSLATVASQQTAGVNTQLSASLAALSTAAAQGLSSTTTTLSTSIASTTATLQAGITATGFSAAAALSAAMASAQASSATFSAQLQATNTTVQGTLANVNSLWANYTTFATAMSTRVAQLATTLTTVQTTITQNLVCATAPPPTSNGGTVSSCTNVPVGGTCIPTCPGGLAPLLAYTCALGGVWTGSPSCGNGLASTTPLASCLAIRNNGWGASMLYWVSPTAGAIPFQVYCDMTSDGGGWAMAVIISGFDQAHSNVNQLGQLPIAPGTVQTPSGSTNPSSIKLSDAMINALMTPQAAGAANIKFVCGTRTSFVKNCVWRATKGLQYAADPCITLYSDAAATVVYSNIVCNAGSQGVGSHCGGSGTLPANAYTYCSHCVNGDFGGFPTGRNGCGNDYNAAYGLAGQLWVR